MSKMQSGQAWGRAAELEAAQKVMEGLAVLQKRGEDRVNTCPIDVMPIDRIIAEQIRDPVLDILIGEIVEAAQALAAFRKTEADAVTGRFYKWQAEVDKVRKFK